MANVKTLYRSCDNKILGGVGAGLAEYFEIDPTLVRLVIALSFVAGFGFLAYLLAWVIIPLDPKCEGGKTGAEEIKEHAEKVASEFKKAVEDDKKSNDYKPSSDNLRFWLGLILIFFATSLILQNLFGYSLWHNFWPIILVAIGIALITGSMERKK
jgi:phage shock protein PspC (stress-responsive transcriptional regulator)